MQQRENKAAKWITVVVAGIALSGGGCQFIRNDKLNQAALAGNAKRTTELMSKGANANGRGMHAMTPIMSAARGGHLNIVELLVERGADVNSHNDSGSALMWAVDSGNEELVSYLLRSGADVGWTNVLGSSALDFAREQNKTNIARLLETQKKMTRRPNLQRTAASLSRSNRRVSWPPSLSLGRYMRLAMTMTRLPLCGASVASSWLAGLFGASLLWNFIYSIGSRVVTDETHYRLHDSVTTWGGIAGVLVGLGIVLLLRRPAPGVLAIGHALAMVTGFFGGSVGWQQGLWAYFGAHVALVIWVAFRALFQFRSRQRVCT